MIFTTTTTSKGQVTIPKKVRDQLGLKKGVKIDIYTTKDGFTGRPHRESKILEYAGDLAHLDKGEPLSEIREKAQKLAAKEIVKHLASK
jgi:AbrB family looped-hinge helix DNA binding protein